MRHANEEKSLSQSVHPMFSIWAFFLNFPSEVDTNHQLLYIVK
jgi:hypothetical protein